MGNRVISYSLRGYKVFLKGPLIIIMRFGQNNMLGTIYINFWVGEVTWFTLHFLFIIHKNEKSAMLLIPSIILIQNMYEKLIS